MIDPLARPATVVVVGAGQAGLSAGYHLHRRGFVSALDRPEADRSFVILDANSAPGGAWQHRWESLTMSAVNGIFDLPGFPGPLPVESVETENDNPAGPLLVQTDRGAWGAKRYEC